MQGRSVVVTPPVVEPGGLPSGWWVEGSLDCAGDWFVVGLPAGYALISERYVHLPQRAALAAVGRQTALVFMATSLGLLADRVFADAGSVAVHASLARFLLPYFDVTDEQEAGERLLVALGAVPAVMPRAACNGAPAAVLTPSELVPHLGVRARARSRGNPHGS